MLPEKQKMQIKTNLIHTHPLYFLCRVLLDERAAQQILGRSLEKSLERCTVKSRWYSEISSLPIFDWEGYEMRKNGEENGEYLLFLLLP